MHSICMLPLSNTSSHDVLACLETNSHRFPLAFDTLIDLIGSFNYDSVKDADVEASTLSELLTDSLAILLNRELLLNPISSFQNNTVSGFTDFAQSLFFSLNLSNFQKELYFKTLKEIYNFYEFQLVSPADKFYFRDSIHCNIAKLAFILSTVIKKKDQHQIQKHSTCLCIQLFLVLESPSPPTDIDLKGKINQLHFSLLELKRILLWKISMYQWLLELPNSLELPSINDLLDYHRDLEKLTNKPSSSKSLYYSSASSQRSNLLPAITRFTVSAPSSSTTSSIYESGISMLESIVENISEKNIKQMDSKMFSS